MYRKNWLGFILLYHTVNKHTTQPNMNTGVQLWRTWNFQIKNNDNLQLYGRSVLIRPVNCKHQGSKWSLNDILKGTFCHHESLAINIGLFHFHSKRLLSRRQNQLERIIEEKNLPKLPLSSKGRGITSQTQELALPAFLLTGTIILTFKSWLNDTKSTMPYIQMTEQMHKLRRLHFC